MNKGWVVGRFLDPIGSKDRVSISIMNCIGIHEKTAK